MDSTTSKEKRIKELLRQGDELRSTCHYEDALVLFKECLQIQESIFPQDDLQIIKTLSCLAKTYESISREANRAKLLVLKKIEERKRAHKLKNAFFSIIAVIVIYRNFSTLCTFFSTVQDFCGHFLI